MAFQAESDLDLISITLKNLGAYKWVDLVSNLQDHPFANEILRREKTEFASGTSIDFNVQTNPQGSARMVGIGAADRHTYQPLMSKGNIPWRGFNANMSIPSETISMNNEPSKIVDIVEEQRAGVYISVAELLETQCWSQPTGSSDDLNFFGVPYWIVPNRTQGFNGTNPFGFAAGAAGISSTTYPNWANYTDSYVEVSKLDLVLKMRRAALFTKFKTPSMAKVPSYSMGDRRVIMTTNFVYLSFGTLAEQQNDNLGNDIASKDGDVSFRRHSIEWAPKLDSLSGSGGMGSTFVNATYTSAGGYAVNPVFFINYAWFRPVFLKGWWMKQTGPQPLWGINHTVVDTQWDSRGNLICRNRREQAVLTQ